MDTDYMIHELRSVAKKYKYDKTFFGQLRISNMCLDTARRLEELMHFKDYFSKMYGKDVMVIFKDNDSSITESFDNVYKKALEEELKGEE